MKKLQSIFFLISVITPLANFACGPFFPSTYIERENGGIPEIKPFEYSYKWENELAYVVIEKFGDTSDWHIYPDSEISTVNGEKIDYKEKFSSKNNTPAMMEEFKLYKKGKQEMLKNPHTLPIPPSWLKLLSLPWQQRRYRTVWTCYMIGNLYASAGDRKKAADFYKAVRTSQQKGFKDTLGLAHATYKREFLMPGSDTEKLNSAIKAIAYYRRAKDEKRLLFVIDSTAAYLRKIEESGKPIDAILKDPYTKEIMISFILGKRGIWKILDKKGEIDKHIREIIASGNSETAARFAWNAYKHGNIETAKKILPLATGNGVLTLWIKAKLALYDGNDSKAAEYMKEWLDRFHKIKKRSIQYRLAPGFNSAEKAEKDVYGILGSAVIHTKDFIEALQCFIRAEDWQSAATVADTLISIEDLEKYVNHYAPEYTKWEMNKKDLDLLKYNFIYQQNLVGKKMHKMMMNRIRYLYARRLVRVNNRDKAVRYMPENLRQPLKNLIYYLDQGVNNKLSSDQRAIADYNAARLMRWYGMSLSGTELWPDYQYVNGAYDSTSIPQKWAEKYKKAGIDEIEKQNFPQPPKRFHYRFKAFNLMRKAINEASSSNIKLFGNIVLGYWLHSKYPQEANLYYKAAGKFKNTQAGNYLYHKGWLPEKSKLSIEIYRQLSGTAPLKNLNGFAQLAEKNLIANEQISQ